MPLAAPVITATFPASLWEFDAVEYPQRLLTEPASAADGAPLIFPLRTTCTARDIMLISRLVVLSLRFVRNVK